VATALRRAEVHDLFAQALPPRDPISTSIHDLLIVDSLDRLAALRTLADSFQ
jgi:hypothetical protein